MEHSSNIRYTFPKKEKLKSQKLIRELFEKGSSTFLYPYKVFYLPAASNPEVDSPQVLISVSKRNFKHAVDRNRLKRQIREAYRLQKNLLGDSAQDFSAIGFLYVGKKKEPYALLDRGMRKALKRLAVSSEQ
ncbi:ribonuclease P protein component [Algivirga pacifica]|uniref:Ribonuclease P protein component n=1 Tax=Algivirga pacifica TaxID=1162670 RepID=A0ABP9DMC4_9BACT